MIKELPKTYEFSDHEERIYTWWENSGFFKPINDPMEPDFDPTIKPFVIVIPPPNVTGELHLGHPLFISTDDVMIRYHRMKGESTLWVPGTDHAGIATQLQVVKMLAAKGLKKEDIGREAFLEEMWAWKQKYGGIITKQIRRMGASCDWTRERFTMDEGLSKAVREAFVRLYEKGLIYRGYRMINWAPGLQTAVSDLEVEYSEELGRLYYFKYMLSDGSGRFIPVATTRPETILGDTAVAVHPEDERYREFIGQKVIVPMLDREVPVIADTYVEREFGTGALKITPGHDPHDYEIGIRHNLEVINILNKDATINENGKQYEGLDRFDCRNRIWEDMRQSELVIKDEAYLMNVPKSQRGGEIVEPMVSNQWFVKIEPLAKPAIDAVKNGSVKIVPERFNKVYFNWMDNIEDWCISRQLWWGHRIPVWYCQSCGHMTVSREDASICENCGSHDIYQDPDVLDTWFSSGLWPFSVLGWPEETPDYKYFYPTSVLATGYDILFFWVARMILDGIEFTGQPPFHTVYLHGLVRDEKGQKMSKTKNNSIDPLTVMDEYGTDALRFTLLVGSTPGNDMSISVKKIEANRNFANKVWNVGRFVIGSLSKAPEFANNQPDWTLADSWIWARKRQLVRNVESLFETYQFGEAGKQIYEFLWNEFADWYLEISKVQIEEGGDRAYYTAFVLTNVLDTILRLLHPFTPYVTEALWDYLRDVCKEQYPKFGPENGWEEALIIAKWPTENLEESWENEKIAQFQTIQNLVKAIRNIRSEKKVAPHKKIGAVIIAGEKKAIINSQITTISSLAGLDQSNLKFLDKMDGSLEDFVSIVVDGVEVYLPLAGLVDKSEEKDRLLKELNEIKSQIERLENLLSSPFSQKAPAAVVNNEREKLLTYKETAQKIEEQLAS